MITLRSFRVFYLALFAAITLALPVQAQQRVQVGSLIERLDRLETEVTRLRVSPGGLMIRPNDCPPSKAVTGHQSQPVRQ